MKLPSALDWVILIGLGILWGGSFFAIKKAVAVYEPLQMASWRMVLAWLIYLPLAIIFWSKIDWKHWKVLCGVAFFGSAIPNFMFAIAQQHVSSGLAGVLNSLTPLFTLLLGVAFFQMPISARKVAGVVMGLSGAIILVIYNGTGDLGGKAIFALLCVLATVCYAINANLVNAHLRDMHPVAIASSAFMLTGPIFLTSLWFSGGLNGLSTEGGKAALWYLLYLAAIGTVVGSILYFWLLQRTSALFATSVTYLLPVVALTIGALDGEAFGWHDFLGTAVILIGVYLARK